MAKGAANEKSLGGLHSKLAQVFIKVLERYENQMDVVSKLQSGELESDMMDELLSQDTMPNPAMLSAISKFLKDNEIMYDTEEVKSLSDLERRLADRRKQRENVVSLTSLPRVDTA
tara:strand:+ start:31115 stop:31462 length:348 start_codon:yes stop_codon:yes gene_type:complete